MNVNNDTCVLRCNHCEWVDEIVEISDYEKYVNQPCPVCGQVLLTEKDYKIHLKSFNLLNFIDKFAHATGQKADKTQETVVSKIKEYFNEAEDFNLLVSMKRNGG